MSDEIIEGNALGAEGAMSALLQVHAEDIPLIGMALGFTAAYLSHTASTLLDEVPEVSEEQIEEMSLGLINVIPGARLHALMDAFLIAAREIDKESTDD